MTDQHSGPGGSGPDFPGRDLPGSDAPGPELDPDEQRLASMLADLADDPEGPPSTVTVASVLAAVRAQAPAADASGRLPALDVSVPHVSAADVPAADVPVPDVPVADVPVQDGAAGSGGSVVDGRHRFHGRRRAVLVGVLAAACLAAVAAVVIPLSVRSSNTTSAESALNTSPTLPRWPVKPGKFRDRALPTCASRRRRRARARPSRRCRLAADWRTGPYPTSP